MARSTLNRRPATLNTSNQLKQYYFDLYNWKGIDQRENFLSVDQETFADAINVYVDDSGLLCSRLPLKIRHKFTNKKIKDLKVFDDIILCAYINEVDGEWYIGFINGESWVLDIRAISYPIKAFRNGNHIYIFTTNSVFSYNTSDGTINENTIYVPITRIYQGSNYIDNMEENLFSSYSKYRYQLFSSADNENKDLIHNTAYDKNGVYSYYINDEKVENKVYIDRENKFLDAVHQPLIYDKTGFYKESNEFNDSKFSRLKPLVFIYNYQLYKISIEDINSVSTSVTIYVTDPTSGLTKTFIECELQSQERNFVKFRVSNSDELILIFDDCVGCINLIDKSLFWFDDGTRFNGFGDTSFHRYVINKFLDYTREFVNGKWNECLLSNGEIKSASPSTTFLSTVVECYSGDVVNIITNLRIPVNENLIYQELNSEIYITDLAYIKEDEYFAIGVIGYTDDISNPFIYDIFHMETNPQEGISYSYFNNRIDISKTNSDSGFTNWKYYGSIRTDEKPDYVDRDEILQIRYESRLSDKRCHIVHGNSKSLKYGYVNLLMHDMLDVKSIFNLTFSEAARKQPLYFNNQPIVNNLGSLYIVLSDDAATNENSRIPIIDKPGKLLTYGGDCWFYVLDDYDCVLSNFRISTQSVDILIDRENEYLSPDNVLFDDKIYISKNSELFVGNIVTEQDGNDYLYFRKKDSNLLNATINKIYKTTDNSFAIFTHDGIWHATESDGVYHYKKSKIAYDLKNNSDVYTLLDSTTTVMPSNDGIIALSYQNFISSTEQATLNLTQNINEIYSKLKNDVRILNWKSYTLFYESNNNIILLYDNRLKSWWQWIIPIYVVKMFVYNNDLYVVSENEIFEFSKIFDDYCDKTDENHTINWLIKSQKLHFNANNYYKHIVNITFGSVQKNEIPVSMNLNVKNYRKYVDNGKAENFDYEIDVIRTFVKRLNYAKVCEFQYELSSDNDNFINSQLALSNITLKYKIGGQLR